jgi:mono/diheme cytochrome c family protein
LLFVSFRCPASYAKILLAAMPANEPRKSGTRKTLFVLLLAFVLVAVAYAYFQENKPWVIPEEAKARKNPLQPSEAALKSAKALYAESCANCHGDSGKGDGSEAMRYDPKPADFTDAFHMNTATDGALFYQISQGRKPMPAFKRRMTEDQRWQLVLLVRSFAQKAAAPEKNSGVAGEKPAPQ